MNTLRFSRFLVRTGTLLAIIALCGSCTLQAPARPQTRMEMLTGGSSKTWRMVEHSRSGAITGLDSCLLDNTFVFSLSGEFINNDGEVLCLPRDNVRELRGNWKFARDSTRIIISGAGMNMTARIATLSSSTLVLEELAEKSGTVASTSTFEAR